MIATGSRDGTIRIWSAGDGREMKQLLHEGSVLSLSMSPDETHLLTASADDAGAAGSVQVASGGGPSAAEAAETSDNDSSGACAEGLPVALAVAVVDTPADARC